jgi:hypothetical protein
MSSWHTSDGLPHLVLVAPRESDADFLALLESPGIAGEFDTL